jgi:methyl-accepting chemotaxis protein
MSSLFSPAVYLANKMSFSSKLLAVVLIFLVPFLWLLTQQWTQNTKIVNSAMNLEQGVELVLMVKPLALGVAKHRGTMAQYLAGAEDKREELQQIEVELGSRFTRVIQGIESFGDFQSRLPGLAKTWASLKVGAIGKNSSNSFAAHTELIESLHREVAFLVNYFDIELQSARDDYYLSQLTLFQVPEVQELLGQLRGRGAGALADQTITMEERANLVGLQYGVRRALSNVEQQMALLNRNQALANYFSADVNRFDTAAKNFDELLVQQVLAPELPTTTSSEFFARVSLVIEAIGGVDQLASAKLIEEALSAKEQADTSRLLLVSLALLSILLGCYIAMGILISLNTSVKSVNNLTQELKSGNFSHTLKVESEDVIGEVADNLTGMVNQVAELINNIQSSADQVNKLSVELQKVTDDTKVELDQQNNQTQQSASAATEMAATVREVARACVEASTATDLARDMALEGQARVNQAIGSINHLGEDVTEAKNIITQLQGDVAAISAVLEVIRSIAEQTNLLALNAAIEAARAGEQGRGFAVVADEVRSLAKRTQDSTSEIRAVIESLQRRAGTAVDIILQSFSGAQNSIQSAASAGESLHHIVQNVEMLRDLNTQIATAAEQQAAVAEQMSLNTRELGDSSENILDQVEKTLSFSLDLRQGAGRLLENTLQFKI